MTAQQLLLVFVLLRFSQYLIEKRLAKINRDYYLDPTKQRVAMEKLGISSEDLSKSLAYAEDRYHFALVTGWVKISSFLIFIAAGGLSYAQNFAIRVAGDGNTLLTGLLFFAVLAVLSLVLSIPFSFYHTFVIEQRHGFNKQSKWGFVRDLIKGVSIGTILGAALLAALLTIMDKAGPWWWVWAWMTVSGFGILTAWLYPTFLAPLFNKFKPLPEGELKDKIVKLASAVNFAAGGLYVMDASVRSTHGNAYFTGVFGKKRIVLFDTLVEMLKPEEVVAVLAHELGHFKLNHVRWMLIRGTLMTGLTMYLLSLFLPLEIFYQAVGLGGVSHYGALVVFAMWFGIIEFLLQPWEAYLSRRNEFAADRFAVEHVGGSQDLSSALLKLREKSHSIPLSHPWYSLFYHSHPPMIERLSAMQQPL